jgi:hypothetical protein
MGHTSNPESLVSDQKITPVKNPKTFIQQDDRGGSLQSQLEYLIKYFWIYELAKKENKSEK